MAEIGNEEITEIGTGNVKNILTHEWNLIREATNKGEVFGENKFKARIKEDIGRKIEFRKREQPKKGKNKPVPN